MKQILLTFIVLFSAKIYSQNYSENFLGDEYELYKGVKAKLKDDLIAVDFSHNFYGDLAELQKKYDGKVLYPSSKYNFVTEKDSLKNRTFLIENIIGKDGNPFDKSKSSCSTVTPELIVLITLSGSSLFVVFILCFLS